MDLRTLKESIKTVNFSDVAAVGNSFSPTIFVKMTKEFKRVTEGDKNEIVLDIVNDLKKIGESNFSSMARSAAADNIRVPAYAVCVDRSKLKTYGNDTIIQLLYILDTYKTERAEYLKSEIKKMEIELAKLD